MRLTFMTAVFFAVTAPAFGASLGPYADFCQSPSLQISPAGRYLIARRGDNLAVMSTDCLIERGTGCPVDRIINDTVFPRGQITFTQDDRWVYTSAAGVSAKGRATGENTIRKFETRAALSNRAVPLFSVALPTHGDMLGDIEVQADLAENPSALARAGALVNRAASRRTDLNVNTRNIYGRISGDRSIYLIRSDDDYSVSYSLDGRPERPLWSNGNPFSQRTSNLKFKFDGSDAIVQAVGSVLRISPKGLTDETARLSRSILIDGDDPARFYGYGSVEGLTTKGIAPSLVAQLKASAASHADHHVSGLTVNNAIGMTVFTYGLFRTTDGQAVVRHDIRQGDRHAKIDCGGEALARHEVRRIGGDKGVFVERYLRDGARKTVLYLSGGPGAHLNMESSVNNDLSLLLDNGFNVDVIHYGGSNYTFAQHDRLYREGPASIATDARLIERYVSDTYGPGDHLSLFASSFGAFFYRRFDEKFLGRMEHVVLAAPAGTMFTPTSVDLTALGPTDSARVEKLSKASNRALWGPRTVEVEARYFRDLRRCPLRGPVTVVVGAKDDVVRPLTDYRLCLDSPNFRVIRHDFGHVSPLTPGLPVLAAVQAQTLKALGKD